jgi:hypothetical protein
MSLPDEIWDRESAAPEMVATVIDVANVTAASTVLAEVPFNLAVDTLISPSTPPTDSLPMTAIEGCSDFHGRLVADVKFHPGVAAIHL